MFKKLIIAAILLLIFSLSIAAAPQKISYQGQLADIDGNPFLDTTLDITFSIYRSTGTLEWTSGPQSVHVVNGLFDYELGSNVLLPDEVISNNFPRFLGIKVGDDAEIVPRTEFVSVPYAYKVRSIDGAIGGSISGTLALSDAGYTFPLSDGVVGQVMSTDGAGQLGWSETTSGSSSWSVTDSVLFTNNLWGLAKGNANNMLYGIKAFSHVNFGVACTTGVDGLNISYATIAGGQSNNARGHYSSIGGGRVNQTNSQYSTLSGGMFNNATGDYSSVSGGYNNSTQGLAATVSGGQYNTAGGDVSTIGGGYSNEIINGQSATIAGGNNNEASGYYTTVGGGSLNIANNSGTVPGGKSNEALGYISFAAGERAKALHDGAFVWADNTNADFASTADNQFIVRADGGVGINNNNPEFPLDVEGIIKARNGFAFPDNSWQLKAAEFNPIGSIIAWLKSHAGTPTFLPSEYVECNGQTLNNSASPFDGMVIPNLNGESRFLRGGSSSGGTGGTTSHTHAVDIDWYKVPTAPGLVVHQVGDDGTYTTTSKSNLPPYYRVVWIMKIK